MVILFYYIYNLCYEEFIWVIVLGGGFFDMVEK